jgi:hypothetical protein
MVSIYWARVEKSLVFGGRSSSSSRISLLGESSLAPEPDGATDRASEYQRRDEREDSDRS